MAGMEMFLVKLTYDTSGWPSKTVTEVVNSINSQSLIGHASRSHRSIEVYFESSYNNLLGYLGSVLTDVRILICRSQRQSSGTPEGIIIRPKDDASGVKGTL